MRTTWKIEILEAMAEFGETFDDAESCTLSDKELTKEFYSDHGGTEGTPFTLWTEKRVYFPVVYDGAEWVGSVPRNPCDEATKHLGGQIDF
jgi:hypothetical protein